MLNTHPPVPLKNAVMECVPTESVLMVALALPDPSTVPDPRTVAPSLKVTVPVGVPVAGALAETLADIVTVCPNVDGFGDVAFVTVVVNACTGAEFDPPLDAKYVSDS